MVCHAPRPPDLAPLRTHRLESGFHGVYPHFGGESRRNRWVAKPFRKQRLGCYPTPLAAARAVAAWWADRHGDRWPAVFRARLVSPWRVCAAPPLARETMAAVFVGGRWETARRPAYGVAYLAVCWVGGERTVCFPPNGCSAYADRASATAGFHLWKYHHLGLTAPVVLSRAALDLPPRTARFAVPRPPAAPKPKPRPSPTPALFPPARFPAPRA